MLQASCVGTPKACLSHNYVRIATPTDPNPRVWFSNGIFKPPSRSSTRMAHTYAWHCGPVAPKHMALRPCSTVVHAWRYIHTGYLRAVIPPTVPHVRQPTHRARTVGKPNRQPDAVHTRTQTHGAPMTKGRRAHNKHMRFRQQEAQTWNHQDTTWLIPKARTTTSRSNDRRAQPTGDQLRRAPHGSPSRQRANLAKQPITATSQEATRLHTGEPIRG